MVDLASSSAVLKTRVGSDFDRTYQAADGFVYIFSQYGIMPIIKHFPGIGSSQVDLHQQAGVADLGADDTRIFSKLLDKYRNIGVMTSHLRLRDKLAGQPCSLSAECLKEFPSTYPQILLITDDLSMNSALANVGSSEEKELTQVAIEALRAGNHVLLFAEGVSWYDLDAVIRALEKEYQDSASFRDQVEAALAKVLSLKR
jgi:beta-N-acetylhexosaminidase